MSLPDLLRVHLRGIKRCPKCRSFNGNRAGACKKCDFVFINGFKKRKNTVDASKIETGLPSSVYSVKNRHIGPDYRGFVELREHSNGSTSTRIMSGTCHVKWCQGFSETNLPKCQHIRAALDTSVEAVSLPLKNSVLNMLNINQEMKHQILKMNTNGALPIVQRVSKHVMAVRTKITKKHRLGYLHTSFATLKTKEYKYYCNCYCSVVRLAKRKKCMMEKKTSLLINPDTREMEEDEQAAAEKCIHFYMCVAAFASDIKLTEEFQYFINLALPNYKPNISPDPNFIERDQTLLSIIDSEDNLVELSENIAPSQELSDAVLSPFVTQMIELPNGSGHMIELHAQLHPGDSHDPQSFTDTSAYELNNIVVYKANSDVVKTCDVMLANTSNGSNDNMSSLDLQKMLVDSGSLINLSNVIVSDNGGELDCNLSISSKPSKSKVKNDEHNLWEVQDMNNAEIINLQEGDNIYTITGDDNSLKIISLEHYDPMFVKKDESNSNSVCSSDANFHFSDILYGNYVQEVPVVKQNKKKPVRFMAQDSSSVIQSDSDDDLVTFDKKKNKESKRKRFSAPVLHILDEASDVAPARKIIGKRKRKLENTQLINNPMLSESYSIQSVQCSNNKLTFDNVANLGLNNNIEFNSLDASLPTEVNSSIVSNIITLNRTKKDVSDASARHSTTYFSVNNSIRNYEEVDEMLLRKKKKSKGKADKVEILEPQLESQVNFGFLSWLSSVTENINQTMHYQFHGKPDALVFHIPHIFFEYLQDRISLGNKKKKLPNQTSVFLRKEAVPVGEFTKYTWNIINIFHIKKIFDTLEMPLDIRQFFMQNDNGTYTQIEEPQNPLVRSQKPKPISPKRAGAAGSKAPLNIRPGNLMTYLKVGCTDPEQRVPTPFRIEWIPNILPKTKIGELRLKFEYGHKQSYISPEQKSFTLMC